MVRWTHDIMEEGEAVKGWKQCCRLETMSRQESAPRPLFFILVMNLISGVRTRHTDEDVLRGRPRGSGRSNEELQKTSQEWHTIFRKHGV